MEGLLFFIKHSLLGAVFQANFLFLANMLQSIQFGEVFSPLSMVKTAQLTLFNFSLLLWHLHHNDQTTALQAGLSYSCFKYNECKLS